MDPIVVFAGATILYLVFRGRSAPEPVPVVPIKPAIPNPSAPPNGVYPDAGMTLTRAQQILIALGYDLGASGADGKYGPKTRAALLAYQKSKGLSTHGYLDTPTAQALLTDAPSTAKTVQGAPQSLGHGAGYTIGFNSRGLAGNVEMLSACQKNSAVNESGGCQADFALGYATGFEQGAFDRGFKDGFDQLVEPAGNSSYRSGYVSGAKARLELGDEPVSDDPADWGDKYTKSVMGDTVFWDDEGGGNVSGLARSSARTARVAGVDLLMVSRERPERMRVDRSERMR